MRTVNGALVAKIVSVLLHDVLISYGRQWVQALAKVVGVFSVYVI